MARRSISTNTTPSTSLVVAPPAGIVNGDILIAWMFSDSSSFGGTPSLPSGFTAFANLPESSDYDGMSFLAGWKKAASESGNYTFGDTHTLAGGVLCMSGEHATLFLHRQSTQANGAPGDATPWDIITPAFSSNTTAVCDIIFIGVSDNDGAGGSGGDVTHTAPSGFTMWSDFGNGGFFNGFVATKEAAAAGETGAYTAQGALTGALAGYAALAIALQNGAAGSVTGSGSLAVSKPAISGSGTAAASNTGSGSLAVSRPAISASGTNVQHVTGSGSLAVPLPKINFGDRIVVPKPSISGSGTKTDAPSGVTGTGSLAIPRPTIAASGVNTQRVTGSGSLSVARPAIQALGSNPTGPPPAVGGGGKDTPDRRRARRYEEMMRELAELEQRAAEQEAIAQRTPRATRSRKAKVKAERLRNQAARKAEELVAATAAQEAEDEEFILNYLMERLY